MASIAEEDMKSRRNRRRILGAMGALLLTAGACAAAPFPAPPESGGMDSLTAAPPVKALIPDQEQARSMWGLDVLLSNDGFGLGAFYRRDLSPDLSGFMNFSISESKDPREVEQIDIFGNSYTPGKLNRFLVLPLMAGLEYRLFREDIMDSFRPYINIGAGPAMIYAMPYIDLIEQPDGTVSQNEVDFFSGLGRGRPHYTASSFIGFGARFGAERGSVFGVNFRYYFTYLFSGGLPSLYNPADPLSGPTATKRDFGGFFITLNVGVGY